MSLSQTHVLPAAPTTTRGLALHFSTWEPRKTDEKHIVYGNGLHTYCRNIADPAQVKTVHRSKQPLTAVRVSPSGSYCATGDSAGGVVVWALDNEANTVKLETQVSGSVTDIAWTGDSERIIIVGEGGGAAMMLSGSSCGDIMGHSGKSLMCVDIRKERPFRAATGGQDRMVVCHQGPPFKFLSQSMHENTANCVRFSPDGAVYISVGSDKAMYLCDGKTGERVGEVKEGAHAGSIYSVAWHPSGKQFLTSSADKSVKLWNLDDKSVADTFKVQSNTVDYMQVGCAFVGETPVSVSLNGDVNVFQPGQEKPVLVLRGHQRPITALCVEGDKVFTASGDSAIFAWDEKAKAPAASVRATGKKLHGSIVSGLVSDGKTLFSCAMDDTLGATDVATGEFKLLEKVAGAPNSIALLGENLLVATSKGLVFVDKEGNEKSKTPTSYTPTCMATNGSIVAVGCREKKVTLYEVAGTKLTEIAELAGEHKSIISAVTVSPSGKVAVGDQTRDISMWQVDGGKPTLLAGAGEMCAHTSGIKSLAFSPNEQLLATGSMDSHIIVWDAAKKSKTAKAELAHLGGVNHVAWVSDSEVVSAGADCSVRTFAFAA